MIEYLHIDSGGWRTARIFVSHSRKDKNLVDLFARGFATTNVKAIYEEFEDIIEGTSKSEKIKSDIQGSNALFVILSDSVQNLPHTRDWVVWETGCANNKDIWVFEPLSQLGKISVIVPHLRHYVIFKDDLQYERFIREIIESYDDSNVLPAAVAGGLAGAVGGAALAKNKGAGALGGATIGSILGYIFALSSKQRPQGFFFTCEKCHSSYQVHISQPDFRCPVCNQLFEYRG